MKKGSFAVKLFHRFSEKVLEYKKHLWKLHSV